MTPSLRAVVVEDERLARRKLRTLLQEEGVDVVAECENARDAIARIRTERPDVLFLDVELPDLDGFELLRHVGLAEAGRVVFVTAWDHYAVQAFGVDAVDYLLKPFDRDRLRQALARARGRRGPADEAAVVDFIRRVRGDEPLKRIVVRESGRIRFVEAERVRWLEAADNYVKVHTPDEEFLVRETLSRLESQLDPERFARVHRRAVVNLTAVLEVRINGTGDHEIVLDDRRTVVPVGRRYRPRFLGRLR